MKYLGWLVLLAVGICSSTYAAESIPTDFKATYISISELETKLAAQGLTVIGKHAVNGNDKYTSIIYTSAELKKLGSAPSRGFIGVLRILHNAETEEVLASNPEYFIRAYFQKDYKDGMAAPVSKALKAALGTLEPTEDALTARKLAKYNFMLSMPKYDDFERVAKGTVDELAEKLEANAAERIVFRLDIKGDGTSLLYGVGLPDGIEKFNEKIETMNQSQLLPYTVLIEDGEANILHAKFYLALSFPRLTMTEFMKIMSVPGDIKDAFLADFK